MTVTVPENTGLRSGVLLARNFVPRDAGDAAVVPRLSVNVSDQVGGGLNRGGPRVWNAISPMLIGLLNGELSGAGAKRERVRG